MIPVMIVPILVGPETLCQMLSTVDERIDHLVIIDNGCVVDDSVSRAAYECADRMSVIRMPANLGVAGSWNLGIKASPFAPWWLIANYDVEWPSGSLRAFYEQSGEGIMLAQSPQPWSAFALSEDAVKRIGLFDEGFHPAYFEDNDYELRAMLEGVKITRSQIPIIHHNSSTLKHFGERNNATYANNSDYWQRKREKPDEGGWSLERRRVNSWD